MPFCIYTYTSKMCKKEREIVNFHHMVNYNVQWQFIIICTTYSHSNDEDIKSKTYGPTIDYFQRPLTTINGEIYNIGYHRLQTPMVYLRLTDNGIFGQENLKSQSNSKNCVGEIILCHFLGVDFCREKNLDKYG